MASSWTIHDVKIRGSLPVAFVTTGEIEIAGILDASADASVPGPGGRDCQEVGNGESPTGGYWERTRHGPKYPEYHWVWSGSGGGGFGSRGETGGECRVSIPGNGGAAHGSAALVPLYGGCRGGGTDPSYRGAGGGAIQLVSARRIRLLDGGAAVGVVHVGGGGGKAAHLGPPDRQDGTLPQPSGGGGGSGGALSLEAPIVSMDRSAALLAAGGGGGGGMGLCDDALRDGKDAPPSPATPTGGECPAEDDYLPPPGGAGASAQSAQPGADCGSASPGAAGSGGGHGRIRINTGTGDYDSDPSAIVRAVLTTGSVGRR